MEKVDSCVVELNTWGKRINKRFKKDIRECKRRLKELWFSTNLASYQESFDFRDKLALLLV